MPQVWYIPHQIPLFMSPKYDTIIGSRKEVMSSRTVTTKGMDKFVETLNDNRFNAHLFASYIANETEIVQRQFFRIALDYLSIMARLHTLGLDYSNTRDISSASHKMYQAYEQAGGTVDLINPPLDMFDINI